MSDAKFEYLSILKSDMSGQVTSLIAYQVFPERPMEAVMWSARRKTWIYGPGLAGGFLFDDQYEERVRIIDRQTAEQIAHETLQTALPTEPTLQAMIDKGRRMGWEFGPPRQ